MKLINLTPHEIKLHVGLFNQDNPYGDKKVIMIEPSGEVARVSEISEPQHLINLDDELSVRFYSREFGEVENLPKPQEDTIFLVSSLVAAATDRDDLYVPYPLVRDDDGKVIGAAGLTKEKRQNGNEDVATKVAKIVNKFVDSNEGPGAYWPEWRECVAGKPENPDGISTKKCIQDIANYVNSLIEAKDDLIHDLQLDISRLQGCHVNDEDYRQGTQMFSK